MDLSGLNEPQKAAVTQTSGAVMVMAGAGSGKTKVLTTRIAYIIDELGVSKDSILALTFTNKAANEMKVRISNILGGIDTKNMWVSTFHSFCVRILRKEIGHLKNYTNSFNIIDEEDAQKIVKDICKNECIDSKPKELRHLISKSKNFEAFSIDDPFLNQDYDTVSRLYEEYKIKNNLLDFDDLIIKTIELFKEAPEVLYRYQYKFEYILVDEFQDTNALQYVLIRMLAALHNNIFVVGDDFQSIYSFRGAKIENIHKFRRDYKDHKMILLEENYRSTNEILNLANCIIDKNPNQIKKVMYSHGKTGDKPILYDADTAFGEASFVVEQIKKLHDKGDSYSDFAIMYRANYISRGFEDVLLREHIPYRIFGGLSFFARKEIKDMTAYLRVLVHPDDNFSFLRIVNEPKRKIGDKVIESLTSVSNEYNKSLFESIDLYSGSGSIELKKFKIMMTSIKESLANCKLPDIIDILLKETSYEDMLKKGDSDEYQDRISNIKEFKSVLKETELDHEDEGLTNEEILDVLLSDLALRSENDDAKESDSVILTTYHQAKGLEFKNVFMVAMEDGIFPSQNSVTKEDVEEERRICYVGITRAKDRLFISHVGRRFLFGFTQQMMPSCFLGEMKREFYNLYGEYKTPKKDIESKAIPNVLSAKDAVTSDLKVGDKVNHKTFGDGKVISINGKIAEIAFALPTGIKKMLSTHPSLTKIN